MQNKHLIIHGGSSEISKELMKLFKNEFNEFTIFCRNKKKIDTNEAKVPGIGLI